MKKKFAKSLSLSLCAVLLFSTVSASVYAITVDDEPTEDAVRSTVDTASEKEEAYKDETVYILADAEGTVQKIIVSDWIQNVLAEDSLQDTTNLSDIVNVKGKESYTLGGNNSCVWNAEGQDIYYQGNIEKELPVQMTVRYTLDGKTVSPEELVGKSGHVTIRFEYQNQQYEEVLIDGKKEKIYVPFTMLTGMLLDTDVFRNVTVSNGKLINDGDRMAVVGIAFPGLQEDLAIDREKLEIPDSIEIRADVENFAMGMTMTLATTEVFASLDSDKFDVQAITDAVSGVTTELNDAMTQLLDGSSQLYDGLCQLLEKSGDLVDGINQLAAGATQLADGADSLDDGAGQLQAGAAQLAQGLHQLDSNSEALNGGAKQVFESLLSMADTQLAQGGLTVPTLTIENYAAVLNQVIASLDDTTVYQSALDQVTAKVTANRDVIEEKVTEAVRVEVEAKVEEQVEALVRQSVTQAVQAQQDSVDAAIEAAMQAEIDSQMQSEAVQTQIKTLTDQNVDVQMQSEEIKTLIQSNTETQVEQLIAQTMSSDEVQQQLQAAAEGAKSVISLKASLDSYNAFYLGLQTYTAGVSEATTGADQLKGGADSLKKGTSDLAAGADRLLKGIQTIKDSMPTLVSGVTELRDGSMQLSDGLKQFNEEGIQKLTDVLDGELSDLANRIRIVTDVAKNYTSFSGISDTMDGGVKFIYKTNAIE